MSKPAVPVILLYDSGWGASLLGSADRCPASELTFHPERLREAEAVVFHVPTAPDIQRIQKFPNQLWVAWSMESCVSYPQLLNLEYMKQFDLTMTYRLDSDLPAPYFGPHTRDELLRPLRLKTATAPAVYFASNAADRSGRMDYVRELMRHLDVDSYGACLKNKELIDDRGRDTKLETFAQYKFTLAFENSIAPDYVTEKFFDPLVAGSVPVYWGAPNIEQFAPGNRCFIDARRFAGPVELAEHLLDLASKPHEYNSYLEWKSRPLRQEFLNKVEQFSECPFSRLGKKLRLGKEVPLIAHMQRDPMHNVVRWLNRQP
jgi:hypothetical protein